VTHTEDGGRSASFASDNVYDGDQTENNKCEVLLVPSAVDVRSRCYFWKLIKNGAMFKHTDELEEFVEHKLI
jgi:hypothetical protein